MARRQANNSSERMAVHVGFYVTTSERADLDARAARTGETLSQLCRRVLLAEPGHMPPPRTDPAAVRALVFELSKVGTNLNQLARRSNEAAKIGGEKELAALMAMETELRSLNAQIAETMARVIEL